MEDYKVRNIYSSISHSRRGRDGDILHVTVPGSKSITNRALLIATLATGTTKLEGVLFSDDSRNFLNCVRDLGIKTEVDEDEKTVIIHGCGGNIPRKEAQLYVGSAGTAARFLTATLGVTGGTYMMDSSEQMKKRPMEPLLDSLKELGCEVAYHGEYGHFPFTITGHGFGKKRISVNIDKSSQFLSALLIASVLSDAEFSVDVLGSHGMAYIEMTEHMMEQFGAGVKVYKEAVGTDPSSDSINSGAGGLRYVVSGDEAYTGRDYPVEPDASAAAYFYAMCPLLGIPVQVNGIKKASLQGDVAFIDILEKMGCRAVKYEEYMSAAANCVDDISTANPGGYDKRFADSIVLLPPADGKYQGIEADMSACSDQAITLAAIAVFAETPTTITGIGHIRLQESDRLTAIVTELGKMGIKTESGDDWIRIFPGQPKTAVIETYDDHRMAMGFSLIGLRSDGIVINDPLCCRKTFENYFDVLDEVCAELC